MQKSFSFCRSLSNRAAVKADYDPEQSTSGDTESRSTSGAWGEPGTGAAGASAMLCTRTVEQEVDFCVLEPLKSRTAPNVHPMSLIRGSAPVSFDPLLLT